MTTIERLMLDPRVRVSQHGDLLGDYPKEDESL